MKIHEILHYEDSRRKLLNTAVPVFNRMIYDVENKLGKKWMRSHGYKFYTYTLGNVPKLSINNPDKETMKTIKPATNEEVEAALIDEPLESSNDVLLSTVIVAIFNQSGRLRIIFLTFLTKLPAVANLVAITRIALSR